MFTPKVLVLWSLLLAGASASAGLMFESRFDYDAATFNKDANGVLGMDNSRIYAQWLRLDAKGNVNENLSYRLRFGLNRDYSAVTSKDNLPAAIDFAYITHKIMPELAFTMGRFWADHAGLYSWTPGVDRYINPIVVTKWWSNYNNGYVTGAKVSYTPIEGQMIDVQLLNQAADSTETVSGTTFYKGQAAGLGVVYKGFFLEKTLTVLASHHAWERTYVAADKLRKENLESVGVQYRRAPLAAGLDYSMGKSAWNTTTTDKTVNSIVLYGSYTIDAFTPKIFVASEKEVVKTVAGGTADVKTDYLRYGVAVEYKPFADTDFRYHVAYTQGTQKADTTGAATLTETHIVAGMKLSADILK